MSKRKITVIPGDGIGPSIIESAIQILTHAGCDFDYDYADAGLVAVAADDRHFVLGVLHRDARRGGKGRATGKGQGSGQIQATLDRSGHQAPCCQPDSCSRD